MRYLCKMSLNDEEDNYSTVFEKDVWYETDHETLDMVGNYFSYYRICDERDYTFTLSEEKFFEAFYTEAEVREMTINEILKQ